jgi:hypothetical protein
MYRTIVLAAASLLALAPATPSMAQDPLTQKELRQLFPGNFTAVFKGYVVKITAKGDGVLLGQMNGLKDSGRWSLTNGQLCISMSSWTSGKAKCTTVVADNGWYRGQGVKFRPS